MLAECESSSVHLTLVANDSLIHAGSDTCSSSACLMQSAVFRSIKACASIGSVVARTCCTMPPTCNSHTHVRETRICSTLAIAVSISPSLFSMCILKLDSSCWTLKTDTSDCTWVSPCKSRRCRSYAANVMLVRVLWRIRALPAKLCNLRLAVLRDGNAESRVLPFFVSTFHV